MTLHTVTTYTVTCDGTLATACDATHPGRPHQCPETVTLPPGPVTATLAPLRWLTVDPWPNMFADQRHYCPTHRHQAPDSDGHVHPDTLPCLAGCPAYGTRQGPLATTTDDVAPLDTCVRCLAHTAPGMACSPGDGTTIPNPCRPVAPGGRLA